MRQPLQPHPDDPSAATHLDVQVRRPRPDALALDFFLKGGIQALLLPEVRAGAGRTDELWQHTCFEAFIRAGEEEGYVELNFAPSGHWAAYRLTGYRSGMSELPISAPRIDTSREGHRYRLRAELSGLPPDASWRVGLSAILEHKDGRKSYWALAHPPGKADFHHPDSFLIELPPPGPET